MNMIMNLHAPGIMPKIVDCILPYFLWLYYNLFTLNLNLLQNGLENSELLTIQQMGNPSPLLIG